MNDLIPLDKIEANPWQTRLHDDPAHVRGLADDIAANGLLQSPLARPHPDKPGYFQLAFGHSRLAAYRLLDWPAMPVDVRELSDRQMSDLAASENAQRKNLTAIETALAIQKRMKDFALTQQEAGAPFGYKTQGAISNLLSLLKLPGELQESVGAGAIPERIARQAVKVAEKFPKETAKALKEVAAAPAAQRDYVAREAISAVLERKGTSLREAVFDLSWPLEPIALNGNAEGDLHELPACLGCQYFFEHGRDEFCLLPRCLELKNQHALADVLQQAVAALGIPAVAPGEKWKRLSSHSYLYGDDYHKINALIKAGKKDATLGLRLMALPQSDYQWREMCGKEYVRVVTTNKAACDKFKAPSAKAPSKATAKSTSAKPVVKSEEEKEEGRAIRAARLRLEADCVWLVQNATTLIAEQLTISGATLAYVVSRLIKGDLYHAESFYGLIDWYRALEHQAEAATGAAVEPIRRQVLVASQIFHYAIEFRMLDAENCWRNLVEQIKDLAAAEGDEPGFGVKLRAGWDRPPVHQSDYNCWACGRFVGQRRITKGDVERGWQVLTQGEQTLKVTCPDCAKPKPTSDAGKQAKKKSKR